MAFIYAAVEPAFPAKFRQPNVIFPNGRYEMQEASSNSLSASGDVLICSQNRECTFWTLDHFRREGEFCDVVLDVEGTKFPAHRNILAAKSEFFRSMFRSCLEDSNEKELKISSLSSSVMSPMLDYYYKGEVIITKENVVGLLEASSFLLTEDVQKACAQFLSANLTVDNCLATNILADRYSESELLKKAKDVVNKNFAKVVENSQEFLTLTKEQLSEIISRDEIIVQSEEECFRAVLKWVKHDLNERQDSLADLLKLLCFASLPRKFIQTQLRCEPLVRDNGECRAVLKRGTTGLVQKDRPSTKCTEVLFGFRFHPKSENDSVFCFDTDNKQLLSVPDLCIPDKNSAYDMTVVDNTLYIMSFSKYPIYASSFDVDTCKMMWEPMASFKVPRYGFGLTVLNGHIYVIGGRNRNSHPKHDVEQFDPVSGQWQRRFPMHNGRMGLCAVSDSNFVYALGGFGMNDFKGGLPSCDEGPLNFVERYDPDTNRWMTVAPMTAKRQWFSAAHLEGKIYVAGGKMGDNSLQSAEVYTIVADEWQTISPPPVHCLRSETYYRMFSINGKLYLSSESSKYDSVTLVHTSHGYSWKKGNLIEGAASGKLANFMLLPCKIPQARLADLQPVSGDFFKCL